MIDTLIKMKGQSKDGGMEVYACTKYQAFKIRFTWYT